jgi:hypothetical protein
MSAHRVTVHVERVLLDGLELGAADRAALLAGLGGELAALLGARGGVPESLRTGGRVARLRATGAPVQTGSSARAVGVQIARAVHGAVAGDEAATPRARAAPSAGPPEARG